MLYLLGVNHLVQYKNSVCSAQLYSLFRQEMAQWVKSLNIQWLFEEYNEDCLLLSNVESSTLQEIAKTHNLFHEFIDPNMKTRRQLGYYLEDNKVSNMHVAIREAYWLKQIQNSYQEKESALIVIGAMHISSFSALLEKHQLKYEVICEYWQATEF